jgi:hypothetical protein
MQFTAARLLVLVGGLGMHPEEASLDHTSLSTVGDEVGIKRRVAGFLKRVKNGC